MADKVKSPAFSQSNPILKLSEDPEKHLTRLTTAGLLSFPLVAFPVLLTGWYFAVWKTALATLLLLYIGLIWWQIQARTPSQQPIVFDPAMLFDRSQFAQFSEGDPMKDKVFFDVFTSSYEKDYAEIEAALQTHDYPTIKLKAHSTKGAAMMLGLKELTARFMELEKMGETEADTRIISQRLKEANDVWKETEKEVSRQLEFIKPA